MGDLQPYLSAIFALVMGLLGIFFAKTGERNRPLNRMGYAILALTVLAGGWSLWEARAKARSAAIAGEKVAVAQGQTALLSNLVAQTGLDMRAPLKYGMMDVDLGGTTGKDGMFVPAPRDGFVGFIPVFGHRGRIGHLSIQVSDVIAYGYNLYAVSPGVVEIRPDAESYWDGAAAPKAVRLSCADPGLGCVATCPAAADGDCGEGGSGSWWAEQGPAYQTMGVRLIPEVSTQKLISRIGRGGEFVTLDLRLPRTTARQKTQIAAAFADTAKATGLAPEFKFYVPVLADQRAPDCESVLILPLRWKAAWAGEVLTVTAAPAPSGFNPDRCEEDMSS